MIEVWNKIDLMDETKPRIDYGEDGLPRRVYISAQKVDGIDLLEKAIAEFFSQHKVSQWLKIPMQSGQLRARLYDMGAILEEIVSDDASWHVKVELEPNYLEHVCEQDGIELITET